MCFDYRLFNCLISDIHASATEEENDIVWFANLVNHVRNLLSSLSEVTVYSELRQIDQETSREKVTFKGIVVAASNAIFIQKTEIVFNTIFHSIEPETTYRESLVPLSKFICHYIFLDYEIEIKLTKRN